MDLTTLHLISLFLTIPVILYADHMGFQYFTGRVETIDPRKVKVTHRLVTIGLMLLIVTGILITVPMWASMFEKPWFYTKIAFVVTLFVNGIFIGALMKKATVTAYKNLMKEEKRLLIFSGVISSTSWAVSILIGFFGL